MFRKRRKPLPYERKLALIPNPRTTDNPSDQFCSSLIHEDCHGGITLSIFVCNISHQAVKTWFFMREGLHLFATVWPLSANSGPHRSVKLAPRENTPPVFTGSIRRQAVKFFSLMRGSLHLLPIASASCRPILLPVFIGNIRYKRASTDKYAAVPRSPKIGPPTFGYRAARAVQAGPATRLSAAGSGKPAISVHNPAHPAAQRGSGSASRASKS